MRNLLKYGAVAALALSLTSNTAFAFTLLGCEHSTRNSFYRVNPNWTDFTAGSEQDQIQAVQQGANAWNNDGGADFDWKYSGLTDINFSDPGDFQNVIYTVPDNGFGTLAVTLSSCTGGGTFVGWDIQFFEGGVNWRAGSDPGFLETDIGGVTAHEFGHALGLGHSGTGNATMFATVSGTGLSIRSLEDDDKNGVQFIYGEPDYLFQTPAPAYFTNVPSGGGAVNYNVTLTNNTGVAADLQVWMNVIQEDGLLFMSPLIGPLDVSLGPDQMTTVPLSLNIPGSVTPQTLQLEWNVGSFFPLITDQGNVTFNKD